MGDNRIMAAARRSTSRFSSVPRVDVPRSQFDLSHGLKTTFDAGYLVPIYVDEALPGDTFNVRLNAFARLATPLKPIMDNLYLDTHFFAIPYRLIWNNWQKFNGQQDSPGDSTDYVIPSIGGAAGVVTTGSLADYMGLPPGLAPAGVFVSALPFRAYALVWNQWFRDENLQTPRGVGLGDGPDTGAANFLTLLKRGKRHDYFTSALPWPQKGVAVTLPLGSTAPVTFGGAVGDRIMVNQASTPGTPKELFADAANSDRVEIRATSGPFPSTEILYADLAAATAASINDIRRAFQVQRLLERDARGGTRYIEIIRSHFGVESLDARLQRTEFLGGGTSFVNISPIAQTSSTDATTPQANLSGIGTVSLSGHGFTKSFTEHCIILGLVSVRADLTYQQGLERQWFRRTRYDFYWPALSMIGEQAILNKEIYVSGSAAVDDLVFGYQERYAEYRYKPSRISGLFRSDSASSLDIWHLSQDFTSLPALNAAFIEENPPIDRVIAVPSEPHFLFDAWFNIKAARPMPVFGVPGMMDHF